VWTYPGVNSFGAGRLEQLTLHPTVKPVALVADAMRDCSSRAGVVLDGFAGSGTLFIAAETGRGGDLIIIDDPLKAADAHSEAKREAVNAWFSNTLLSRLDDKRKGAIVIVMQRVHQNDLVGHLLEQSPKEWTILSLPAVAEEPHVVQIDSDRAIRRPVGHVLHEAREPLTVLASMQAALGSDLFAAQYQQSPVPPGGAMIRRAWVRREPIPSNKAPEERLIHSWDSATKAGETNDWSVCTVWRVGPEGYRLIEVVRERLEYQELKRRARNLVLRDAPDAILIEDAGVGSALIADLRAENFAAIGIRPEADKITRLAVKAPLFESGRVILAGPHRVIQAQC